MERGLSEGGFSVETHVIIWTDYLKYRAGARGFDLEKLEDIIRHSSERYFDTETTRHVIVGKYGDTLIMIPFDEDQGEITPVTVHATTRQQIRFRVNTGRFVNE
jgi:hypothetical protein